MRSVLVDGRPVRPSKIVCIGRNYAEHVAELGNEMPDSMVIFAKPNSAIGDTLYSHRQGEPLHYEGEIALMVEGGRYAAVAFGLDLTRRALQSELKARGLPWERAKAFDGAALFGPFVPLTRPPESLGLRLHIDDELAQEGQAAMMLYPPSVILQELAAVMSLEDGDIIMTGTPAGVGAVEAGRAYRGTVLAVETAIAHAQWRAAAEAPVA
jgi:2-keto-4-pentenoate hydratase/2-oxohepta-3-ene-1,7-dioic acid hydratase in catechol pathway